MRKERSFRLGFISGASSGLGKALCYAAAARGIPLFITARGEDALKELAQKLSVPVEWMALDLCEEGARRKLIERLKKLSPDLVINNAGSGLYGDALSHSTKEQMDILELNAHATLEISLEVARRLIEEQKKGVILNVSSAAAFFSYPTFSIYAASKGCVNQFSLAFDKEISPYGVRCLTACPGQIATSFRERAAKGYPQHKDTRALSAERAAEKIFKQIEEQKTLTIFPFPYKIAIYLSRLLPQAWVQRLLVKALRGRYRSCL